MGTQTVAIGLILYFLGIGIFVTLLSAAGAFSDSSVVYNNPAQIADMATPDYNESYVDTEAISGAKPWNIGVWFKDIFSFFAWDIHSTDSGELGQYFWLVRVLFVYLPMVLLIITIYYSMPTVSG